MRKLIFVLIFSVVALLLNMIVVAASYAQSVNTFVNPSSPIRNNFSTIVEIYYHSCSVGISPESSQTYPLWSVDVITNQFMDKLQRDGKRISKHIVRQTVFEGFETGRTLFYADMTESYRLEICNNYALNHAASVINTPANWNDISAESRSDKMVNPLYDIIRVKNFPEFKISSRSLISNGCRYMYTTLQKHPVIKVSTLDLTLEMMRQMLWNDFKGQDIRFSYSFILHGAKYGEFLFNFNKDLSSCYD